MPPYWSGANLARAAAIAAVCLVAALPRLAIAGRLDAPFLGASWAGLILVAGAAGAWAHEGGLRGLFPACSGRLLGLAVAAGLLLGGASGLAEPAVAALLPAGDSAAGRLAMPRDPAAVAALILWDAGVETLLFHAAAVCLVARVTGSLRAAVLLPAVLRVGVAALRLAPLPAPPAVLALLLLLHGARALAANWLFARGGLLPAALLAVAAGVHRFSLR